jgi:hypothetical protein
MKVYPAAIERCSQTGMLLGFVAAFPALFLGKD